VRAPRRLNSSASRVNPSGPLSVTDAICRLGLRETTAAPARRPSVPARQRSPAAASISRSKARIRIAGCLLGFLCTRSRRGDEIGVGDGVIVTVAVGAGVGNSMTTGSRWSSQSSHSAESARYQGRRTPRCWLARFADRCVAGKLAVADYDHTRAGRVVGRGGCQR